MLLILAGGWMYGGTAHAMRCSNNLISLGDPAAKVLESCGSPACVHAIPPGRIIKHKAGIPVPLSADQEWVYNFGPHRFIHYVKFYQGRVVDAEPQGDYGWTGHVPCGRTPWPC